MSFQAMANLATVLLALPVALFPAVAQAEALAALGCRAHTWDTPARPREGPTIPDAVYFQAVNMTDFAAELKAADWSQLALGSTNFIYDHASGAFDEKAPSIFWSTPGKPLQGMPHQNQKFCRYEWNQNWVSFRRKDAMAQIDRFCGSGSPLYGKAIKGPLTAVLRIPTPPQDTKYHDDRAHPIDMGWYWLEWVLYVEDGCEWMHDEADCLSYMHGALDGCSCDDASEKWGGAIVNRCYGFGLWMGPSFFDLHACPEQVRGAETWALEDCTRTWAG